MTSYLSIEERMRMRAFVSATLATLLSVDLYWLPETRRLIARKCNRVRAWTVPDRAQWLGNYSHPIPSKDVIDDLEAKLAKQAVSAVAATDDAAAVV